MGTTKLSVTKDGLSQVIDRAWTGKLDRARKAYEDAQNIDAFSVRLREWREAQQRRIHELSRLIEAGMAEDGDIASFMVAKMPEQAGSYDLRRMKDKIEDLQVGYDRARNRFMALSWPESGEREFTESQLTNMFGV